MIDKESQALPDTLTVQLDEKNVALVHRYPALVGWEMRAAAIDFTLTDDRNLRRAFTLEVLKAASVNGVALSDADTINKILTDWRQVEKLFTAILAFNDIEAAVREFAVKEASAMGVAMGRAMVAQFESVMAYSQVALKAGVA